MIERDSGHHHSRPDLIAALVVSAALILSACGAADPAPLPIPTPAPSVRPDILLVLTDDLDVRTSRRMPRLTSFANSGVEFTESFVTQSVCGPSRISLLTGVYPHNHGATKNGTAFQLFRASGGERATVATLLRESGYRTALLGKYSNGYPLGAEPNYIPPGWSDWFVHLTANLDLRYYVYTLNENGTLYDYGSSESDYDTDVIARKSVDLVRSARVDEPLFLMLSVQAPHDPAVSLRRHWDRFLGIEGEVERVPSFNEDRVSDKPIWVNITPQLTPQDEARLDNFQRSRLQTLLAVEEMMDQVLGQFRTSRSGRPLYVVFTSDNGLLLGEHRVVRRKGNPYEEAIRVPLFVFGTEVRPGQKVADYALNIDVTPTLLELAGVALPPHLDGRSLVPFLRGQKPPSWRTDLLVEDLEVDLTGTLRNRDWSYTEWGSGERELYDMNKDPWQMESLHRKADPVLLETLASRLHALEACRAATCRD